jgi:hypothetical protein
MLLQSAFQIMPKKRPHIVTGRALGVLGVGHLILALCSAPAWAVGVNGAASEAPADTMARRVAEPPRSVEVVVVWGFRLRSTIHDARNPAFTAGYTELVGRQDCITKTCGFVLVREGNVWRASNTLAASENELLEKQRDMEREDTVLVIVHPNGTRRLVPRF